MQTGVFTATQLTSPHPTARICVAVDTLERCLKMNGAISSISDAAHKRPARAEQAAIWQDNSRVRHNWCAIQLHALLSLCFTLNTIRATTKVFFFPNRKVSGGV